MNAVHLPLLHVLCERLEGSKLNGPYGHDNKTYYQWSLRGPGLEALIKSRLLEELASIDPESHRKYRAMVDRYFKKLDRIQ